MTGLEGSLQMKLIAAESSISNEGCSVGAGPPRGRVADFAGAACIVDPHREVEDDIATIRDVARAAGVSVSTVSRVLNEPGIVRADKRDAVTRAIDDLKFRPNHVARSLKSKSFGIIALVVSDISNVFFAEMVNNIEGMCAEHGYDILLCNLDNQEDRLIHYLREIPHRGVDGLIISGSAYLETPDVLALLKTILTHRIPMVFSGYRVPRLDVPAVVNDSTHAIHDLAAHLRSTGRQHIAYLGGPDHSAMARHRLRDFRAAAVDQGIALDERLIHEIDYDFEAGRAAVATLLAVDPELDAVVCGGDQMAIGAMRGLKQAQRSIPGDVAVIGFDDTMLARFTDPPLTSIAVNIAATAKAAVTNVLAAIEGPADDDDTLIASELVVRESSALECGTPQPIVGRRAGKGTGRLIKSGQRPGKSSGAGGQKGRN